MSTPSPNSHRREAIFALLLFALLLLASPFFFWWATPQRPWYLPYLAWGLVVALTWLLRRAA